MPKKTVADIQQMKREARRVTMLTAYEVGFARMIDQAGVDMVLVGDSLGMVALGYDSTVPVTMDEMLHHARAVARGIEHAVLVGDMPFLSYQVGVREAVANAGRFFKEAGCDAVKLEGGREVLAQVEAIVRAGMPVMGHIGLTPQTAGRLGGFKVQGRDLDSARRLVADARALAGAGVFALVLECVPDQVAAVITEAVAVPTIGIGAGPHCDGQVLVTHDIVGLFDRFTPRFVKKYANLAPIVQQALATFVSDVASGAFPGPEHTFAASSDLREQLLGEGEDQGRTDR